MDWPEFLESSIPQEPMLHLFGASSHNNREVLGQADRWTPEEKRYFENVISRYNNPGSQPFFEFVASKFPRKSLEEIKNQYITLFKDVKMANSINYNDVVVIVDDDHQHQVKEEDNPSLNGVPPQVKNSHSRRRRRGIPWIEGEHQLFLMGQNKFGKGDWKSLSKYYFVSKTSTQVASHAQKYFCRRNSQIPVDRHRPSINDIQTVTLTPKKKTTSPPKINNNILAYNNCQVRSSSMPFHYPNYYPFGGPTFTNNSNGNFERYHRGEASSSNSFVMEQNNNNNNNLQRPKSPRLFLSMYLSYIEGNNPQV